LRAASGEVFLIASYMVEGLKERARERGAELKSTTAIAIKCQMSLRGNTQATAKSFLIADGHR
jgi:hypothetical protein